MQAGAIFESKERTVRLLRGLLMLRLNLDEVRPCDLNELLLLTGSLVFFFAVIHSFALERGAVDQNP